MIDEFRAGLRRRLQQRVVASGQLVFPAVPSMRTAILQSLVSVFEGLGRPLSGVATAELDALLVDKLNDAFAAAPQSNVFVRYELPRGLGAPTFAVASAKSSLEDEYDYWVSTRTGSLFGNHADAKVLEAGRALGGGRALDVGAGAGRNTRGLAALGLDVVAVELSPALADITRDELEREGVQAEVICADIFDASGDLSVQEGFDLIVVAEVVPHLRSVEQFEELLGLLGRWGSDRVNALISAFICQQGYEPDDEAREICQVQWSSCFTASELERALTRTGWRMVSDESVLEFEKRHLPPDAWPPTSWFMSWASGRDAFDAEKPPIELRWLSLERTT